MFWKLIGHLFRFCDILKIIQCVDGKSQHVVLYPSTVNTVKETMYWMLNVKQIKASAYDLLRITNVFGIFNTKNKKRFSLYTV